MSLCSQSALAGRVLVAWSASACRHIRGDVVAILLADIAAEARAAA